MADVTKVIAVQALWDGTKLEAGTNAAEAAMLDLQQGVGTASTSINSDINAIGTTVDTQFNSTIPSAVDSGAVNLTTKASKFRAVGTELGTQLAQGTASGVSAPEQVANMGSSLSGLLAASAGTAGGAAAAVGLGLGVALITNLIKAANERKAEFVASVNDAFQSIEVKAKDSFADIRAELIKTFDFKTLLEELGSGDPTVALQKIRDVAEDINKPFNELVDVLRGDVNPENQDTLKALQAQSQEVKYQVAQKGSVIDVLSEEAKLSKELLDFQKGRSAELRETTQLARSESEYYRQSADAAERIAAALERVNQRNPAGDGVA